MRQIAVAALTTAMLFLAACATTPDSSAPAPVDTAKPPANVQTQPVKPVDVTGTPGGASVLKGAIRVTFWSALAMAVTAAVGKLFGTAV